MPQLRFAMLDSLFKTRSCTDACRMCSWRATGSFLWLVRLALARRTSGRSSLRCIRSLEVLPLNPSQKQIRRVTGRESGSPPELLEISSMHPTRDVVFSGQILAQKKPEIISVHDVWEQLKQALLASRDVIISSQIRALKLQRFFISGKMDVGCPWEVPGLPQKFPKLLGRGCDEALFSATKQGFFSE